MRICLVTHCFPHTDHDVNGNWIPQFVKLLIERGHHVSVLTPRMYVKNGNTPKTDWPFDVRYFCWRGGERRLGQLNLLHPADTIALVSLLRRGRIELERRIDEQNIDLCLGVWTIPSGYFCMRAKQRRDIPYAVWMLGSDLNVYGRKRFFRRVISNVLRRADFLFANSNQLLEQARKLAGKACEFMPTNRILPSGDRSPLELDKAMINFLYVGRLEKVKGIDILVEAMIHLLRKGREASLYVVGDGSLRPGLISRLREKGIEDRVSFVGWADPNTVAAYLRACDLLVVPSRSEGMPVVYWEAMQAGKPVIVTDAGDMAYYTREFRVGKVVPPDDAESLGEALEEFLDGAVSFDEEGIRKLAEESSLENAADIFLQTVLNGERSSK